MKRPEYFESVQSFAATLLLEGDMCGVHAVRSMDLPHVGFAGWPSGEEGAEKVPCHMRDTRVCLMSRQSLFRTTALHGI